MFGLTIFPMKKMFPLLESVMRTMKGRLNFRTGILRKERRVIPTPVAAAAVAPASSTSSVAWCTTFRGTEQQSEGQSIRGRLDREKHGRWFTCHGKSQGFSILTSETLSFRSEMPLKSAAEPNMSCIPISLKTFFRE